MKLTRLFQLSQWKDLRLDCCLLALHRVWIQTLFILVSYLHIFNHVLLVLLLLCFSLESTLCTDGIQIQYGWTDWLIDWRANSSREADDGKLKQPMGRAEQSEVLETFWFDKSKNDDDWSDLWSGLLTPRLKVFRKCRKRSESAAWRRNWSTAHCGFHSNQGNCRPPSGQEAGPECAVHTHTHLSVVASLAVDGRQQAVTLDAAALSGDDAQGHLLCFTGAAGHG